MGIPSGEEYWIIPTVCTYRDFTNVHYDDSIGDNFFKKSRENKNQIEKETKDDIVPNKREKSITSLDSGVGDKESNGRYSTDSSHSACGRNSSDELSKASKKKSNQELLILLEKIKNTKKEGETKPKPKLRLSKQYTCTYPNIQKSPKIETSINRMHTSRISSRISTTYEKNLSDHNVNSTIISKRSRSSERVSIVLKTSVVRSSSLKVNGDKMSKSFQNIPVVQKKAKPGTVVRSLSTKISIIFSSVKRNGSRSTSEPPKKDRLKKNPSNSSTPKRETIKMNTHNRSASLSDSNKGSAVKGKIMSIIEKLSKARSRASS
uniref:Dentin sialophosphoprotein-like n=1 Tax=Parastrongyloides trichosuri TaxID=131310 RepID=A0A0N4ZYP7_PARTI